MTDQPNLPAIDITDLTVAYQDKPVLWDIDLQVPQGVLLAIVVFAAVVPALNLLVPADSAVKPGRRRHMASAVGLRSWLRLQTNSRLIIPVPAVGGS